MYVCIPLIVKDNDVIASALQIPVTGSRTMATGP
jgi:hypothetical protein